MSRELLTWLVETYRADSTLIGLLGTLPGGIPAVFSYHDRVQADTGWPRITVARFGSRGDEGRFDESEFAQSLDSPRIAICAWSRTGIDEAYQLYKRADQLFRGPNVNVSNQYFGSYRIKRTTFRDDLFDETAVAFHLHAEYQCWLHATGTAQPY